MKGINEVLAPKAQILVANTGTHFDRIKRKKQQAEALARAELQQRSKDVTNINAADNGESVVPSSKNPRRRSFDNAATESGKKTTTTAGSVAPSSSASETMNELDQLINKNVETKAPGGGRRSSVATSKPTASVQNSVPTPEVTPPVDAAASSTEGHGHGADMASIQAAIAAKNRVKNRRRSL